MQVEKSVGEHGDVHYLVKFRGETLRLTFGYLFPAKKPSAFDASWKMREWKSEEWSGRDYRKAEGGLRSRYLTLEILGCIEYTNAPAEVARAFDLVMDSMCLRPLKKR